MFAVFLQKWHAIKDNRGAKRPRPDYGSPSGGEEKPGPSRGRKSSKQKENPGPSGSGKDAPGGE